MQRQLINRTRYLLLVLVILIMGSIVYADASMFGSAGTQLDEKAILELGKDPGIGICFSWCSY